MMRWWLRTALAVMVLCAFASVAMGANPVYTMVKADTLTKFCSDSSDVLRVDAYDVMSLEFIATPAVLPSGVVQSADTLIELLVSVREHLPARMLSTTASDAASTASDSTVIAWLPRYGWSTSSQATDTMTVNNVSPAAVAAGSNEIRVWIRPSTKNVNGVLQRRTATLDLINTSTGKPFSAKWATIKWRLASGPSLARLRVILKGERW